MTLNTVYRLIEQFGDACTELVAYTSSVPDDEHEVALKRKHRAAKRKLRAAVKELLPVHSLVPRAVEDMF